MQGCDPSPSQARNGWRPPGSLRVSPLHHLRTAEILSKQPGPPHSSARPIRRRRLPRPPPRTPHNGDVPPIDVHFLEYPDSGVNELGARGIGEIGLAGFAAAVTAAVHHATGVRVRELPVKIEDLLA